MLDDISQHIPVLQFIENVGSAPKDVISRYAELISGTPVAINANLWGWVQRNRIFWLASSAMKLNRDNHASLQLPEEFSLTQRQISPLVLEVARSGSKAWPVLVPFEDGFVPAFAPGTQQRCMHTFTREFHHPADRTHTCSSEAVNRFHEDARRFPPAAYEQESLLWRKEEWRQPTPTERALIHGMPPCLIRSLQSHVGKQTIAMQNSAVGNGYHLPSMMLALFILFQLVGDTHAAPHLADNSGARVACSSPPVGSLAAVEPVWPAVLPQWVA